MPARLTVYRLVSLIGFLCIMAALFLPLKGLSAPATAVNERASATPTPAATPPDQPAQIPLRGNIYTYVTVMDPNIVEDVFGKRISDRFVAIQVTITNRSPTYQFLIHDVSLDLRNVFGKNFSQNLASESVRNEADPSMTFQLSSLELSLVRGVAEKGQAQDKRNKLLRYLEGAGTVAASFIGFAGVGPKFSDFMALYNGDFLAAYRHIYPDFTTNQMSRLSDSAYKSNTLIAKQQAKVIVAFIPQAMFLTPKQRKDFREDPTSLYPNYNSAPVVTSNTVDFRRAVALVDGNFIVELQNLPVTLTGVQIPPDQALEFLKSNPVVKGYILGQFPEGVAVSLVNPPTGMQIAPDTAANSEEGKLSFVITSNAPVSDGTQLTFRVFNKQNSQTFTQTISYTIPVPHLDAQSLEGIAGGPDVPIELPGTNLIDRLTTLAIFNSGNVTSGVKIENKRVETKADGTVSIKATLTMTGANVGSFNLKAKNGNLESNPISLDVKAKPKPTPTP